MMNILINSILIDLILITFLVLVYRTLYNKIPDMKMFYGMYITNYTAYTEIYENWFPLLVILWFSISLVSVVILTTV